MLQYKEFQKDVMNMKYFGGWGVEFKKLFLDESEVIYLTDVI